MATDFSLKFKWTVNEQTVSPCCGSGQYKALEIIPCVRSKKSTQKFSHVYLSLSFTTALSRSLLLSISLPLCLSTPLNVVCFIVRVELWSHHPHFSFFTLSDGLKTTWDQNWHFDLLLVIFYIIYVVCRPIIYMSINILFWLVFTTPKHSMGNGGGGAYKCNNVIGGCMTSQRFQFSYCFFYATE